MLGCIDVSIKSHIVLPVLNRRLLNGVVRCSRLVTQPFLALLEQAAALTLTWRCCCLCWVLDCRQLGFSRKPAFRLTGKNAHQVS